MSDRPKYEAARDILIRPDAEPMDVNWDKKPPPTAPPDGPERVIPEHLKPVWAWFTQIIADESILLDLAMERAITLVEFHHNRGMVGIDYFPEAQPNGAPLTRASLIAIAGQLAIPLYQEANKAVEQRKGELLALMETAKGSVPTPNPS